MRFLAAAATIAACMAVAHIEGIAPSFALPGAHKQTAAQKPPPGAAPAARRGTDTCRYARDNECDEPDIGTGACALNTDYSDCRALREGENDSCRWANDGECDEPQFGTGACTQGTDRTDCGAIAWMRNQNDSCATAFNGVCEEPGRGDGSCAARTDRTDCNSRERPMTINDHFFGRDDRALVNVNEAPWRFMGRLTMSTGESCSATLIAPNVIASAAHCIHTARGVNASGRFTTADGQHSANVIAYQISPRFNYQRFNSSDDIDGLDWALLRLDQPLGDRVGHANVANITAEPARALSAEVMQAGYSWDTGDQLSGNLSCRIIAVNPDHTFAHECDTTRGDSGSGFVVRNGDGFDLIGVDSSFRANPDGPFIYIAVSANNFADAVPDFVAGRAGRRVPVGATPKPAR
ncbi:MAG TPA: trypsin-like serine protease [Terricaulis sp.]|nr:trypsin-like serine protease [Terricaulis sp.]